MADFLSRKSFRGRAKSVVVGAMTPVQKFVTGPFLRARRRGNMVRCLEIGPGNKRVPEFETLNVVGGPQVDYVSDATKRLPFSDGSFDIVYASHILEHVAWYQTAGTLKEWCRVLKPGGRLEIWLPDGLKIAEAFVAAERKGSREFEDDGWWRFNEAHDPCVWAAGRIFSYGDGSGAQAHFNWHISLFSERRLGCLMSEAGLVRINRLSPSDVRGHDHGWINLGMVGSRPKEAVSLNTGTE